MMENYMVILFSVRENEPLWRNWQTHLTQNQAGNTVPVRVRPAAFDKKRTYISFSKCTFSFSLILY